MIVLAVRRRQPGPGDDRAHLVLGQVGEQRLADRGAVRQLTACEVALEANDPGAIDSPEHDRVGVVEHADARRPAGLLRHRLQGGKCHVEQIDLAECLVAEARERESELVPTLTSLAELGDVAARRQGAEHGEHRALRRVEPARELGQAQPDGVGLGQCLERVERAFHAPYPVAFVSFGAA